MATLQSGQLFTPNDPAELRGDLVDDFRLEARKAGGTEPAVSPGTDNYYFFTAVGNAGWLQYGNIATIRPAITPLYATGEDLENWRLALRLPVVQASPASGKLTISVSGGGSVTLVDGQQFLYPSGLRGKVSGTQENLFDESDVNVVAIDTGSATNLDIGGAVRWYNPPFTVATDARVSINGPLTGGFDAETEERKRARILNRLQNTPGGGNWGQLREIAFNTLPSVTGAYVFPALGGPSSDKLTILKNFDRARSDYHRAFQIGAVSLVRNAVHAQLSTGDDHVVGTGDEQACDMTLELTLPQSSLSGGSGLGWVDQRPWPPAGSGSHPAVSAATGLTVTINAATTTAPVAGQAHIMWWAPGDMKMRTYLVTNVTGSTGAWLCTLDRPAVDSLGNAIAAGDYISPACSLGEKYGNTFLDLMEKLGCGENVDVASQPDGARRARHPFIGDGSDIGITARFLAAFMSANKEIVDGAISYLPVSSPPIPPLLMDNPNVLVPRHFAVLVKP